MSCEVTEIDPAARRVRTRQGASQGQAASSGSAAGSGAGAQAGDGSHPDAWEPFDKLVIATGASPIRPKVPGLEARGVYSPTSLDEGLRLRALLDEGGPRRAVIVGGGYIGIEMAEALVLRGLEVSLVDMLPQVMGTLDADMAALVAKALEAAGVSLHLEEALEGFESHQGWLAAVRTNKGTLPADVAVLGLGVRPNSALAAGAGLALGDRGAIKVDDHLRTAVGGIWAAGDCAESFHLVSRRPAHIALGSVANKHGRVVGINVAGGDARFPGVVGTAVTKFLETEVARTGLGEREAQALGLDYAVGKIDGATKARYYPGAAAITVKLLAERGSGRLLGSQIVGGAGSAKRIDSLAVALHAGLTVEDVVGLDLGYAPPFSGVWDPVHLAARQAVKLV